MPGLLDVPLQGVPLLAVDQVYDLVIGPGDEEARQLDRLFLDVGDPQPRGGLVRVNPHRCFARAGGGPEHPKAKRLQLFDIRCELGADLSGLKLALPIAADRMGAEDGHDRVGWGPQRTKA